MKVQVAVPNKRTVSVDVKQHFNQLLAALASVDFKQNVYLLLADG